MKTIIHAFIYFVLQFPSCGITLKVWNLQQRGSKHQKTKKAYDHDYEHKWCKQVFKDDWKNGMTMVMSRSQRDKDSEWCFVTFALLQMFQVTKQHLQVDAQTSDKKQLNIMNQATAISLLWKGMPMNRIQLMLLLIKQS